MSATGQELEVKFYLSRFSDLAAGLAAKGAQLLQTRVHEINLRFDTPAGDLGRSYRVLRLRQDTEAHLTYKGPGEIQDGVRLRQELEFTVSDFATAHAALEALGYQVVLMYEKFRTTYKLGDVLVVLDEMPYGNFVEIEGPDGASIQAAARRLGLDWEKRTLDSYTVLFERVRLSRGLAFRDLSFDNFAGLQVTAVDFGLETAM
jgi:adenylate cyclase class 2